MADLSFDELAGIMVTTVSRHEEELFDVPAAMDVLTREAVGASGALTLPEALRGVAGLNVARISADAWAVGARGFQSQFANKLLVMIDGRSIYSPFSGGVRWEDNPVFLEDLERVEVVRGPGSSVWGANAMNGVINIVTRTAFETEGTLAFGGTGTDLESVAGLRHGIRLSEQAAVRLYGQQQSHGDLRRPDGTPAADGYRLGFGGLRLDWNPAPGDTVTVQLGGHERETEFERTFGSLTATPTYTLLSRAPVSSRGRHVSAGWMRADAGGSSLQVQVRWSRQTLSRPELLEDIATSEVDANYSAAPGGRHRLSAGLGYRLLDSRIGNRLYRFDPEPARPELFNAFIQDEMTLGGPGLKLSLGTKVEHHWSTGWNLQPTARLNWQRDDGFMAWASLSRALRVPTLIEQTAALDVRVFPPGVLDPTQPASVRILGNPELEAEKLLAAEAGFRWRPAAAWFVDLAAFAYDYRDYVMVTGVPLPSLATSARVIGQRYTNGIAGEAYGGELAVRCDLRPGWRLGASVNFLRVQLHTRLPDFLAYEADEDTTPRTSVLLTSDWRRGRWQAHVAGRYVAAVRYYGIPAYAALDARVGFRLSDALEISLVGRNLLDGGHPEYDWAINRHLTEAPRTLNLTCQWRR